MIQVSKYGQPVQVDDLDIESLCGWEGPKAAIAAMQEPDFAAMWVPFALTNAPRGFESKGKTVRGWEIYEEQLHTGPDLTPQPTGCCVAAAADDIIQLTQAVQIAAGEAIVYQDVYTPYLYATGRNLVGQGRLKGGQGSLGSWQAKAAELHGVLSLKPGLPVYNKANTDAWGDDLEAEGQSFRDHLEEAKNFPIRTTAMVRLWEELRDALYAKHFATIASSCGYTMKPDGRGFHRPSGKWPHQMGIWGYSENPKYPMWVAIKNQWGDAHGQIIDYETGKPWPKGFLRVPLHEFIDAHLNANGTECIVYSGFTGFAVPRIKTGIWSRKLAA